MPIARLDVPAAGPGATTGSSSARGCARDRARRGLGRALGRSRIAELVAAEARHGVAGAQAAGEPSADLLQQLVAGVVAERVVDLLEAVEVHQQHRDLLAVALGGDRSACSTRSRNSTRFGSPVSESWQRLVAVELGLALERLFGELALGDVLEHADGEARLAGRVAHQRHRHVSPDGRAVLAQVALFDPVAIALAGHDVAEDVGVDPTSSGCVYIEKGRSASSSAE